MDLNGIWKLADFDPGEGEFERVFATDFDDSAWLSARVPGDVHLALVQAGRIEPPFYHMNVEACKWVEEREWWYRTTFGYDGGDDPNLRHELVFDGLDTICTVYLNGQILGRNENIFVPITFDVTGKLQQGLNRIALRFDPILPYVGDRQVPGQWTRRAPERAWVRKSQYHFGWDWGPRILTIGPWQGVRLKTFNRSRIKSVFFQTCLITFERDRAEAAVDIDIEDWSGLLKEGEGSKDPIERCYSSLKAEVTLKRSSLEYRVETRVRRDGRASAAFSIPFPDLWWTHDLGTPALYDLEVVLESEGQVLDVYRDRVGLRTITWDQSPDADEPGCHFFLPVLNGVRFFAKGANWIPADSFLSEIDEKRYRDWLELAVEANMNMLRVWGGGVYEKDAFYKLCDEFGILIWQDFMYACALYPDDDPGFYAEAEREARAVILRLRNHPSIALWCGNNENDWIDDQRTYPQPRDFPGKRICHKLLPSLVAELDPTRFYWPSSPYGGHDPNDATQGDRHNWQAWHGLVLPRRSGQEPVDILTPEGVSFRHYAEDLGRFISEFGMHGLPILETLRRNVPEEELQLGSQSLHYRNKDAPKDKGDYLLRAHTGLPSDLEQYIDFSMIAQAEGIKFAIEHFRCRKPHCSGALYWALNDCWPGISSSLLDYYRFPKAGYFYIQRAYAPVIALYKSTKGGFDLWLVNDTMEEYRDEIAWGVERFTGQSQLQEQLQISVPSNSAQLIRQIRQPELWKSPSTDYLYVHSGCGGFPSNRCFLAEVKDLRRPSPQFRAKKTAISEYEVEVTLLAGKQFVYYVKVECPIDGTRYSDNYIDLFPNSEKVLYVRNVQGRPITPKDVTISSLPV